MSRHQIDSYKDLPITQYFQNQVHRKSQIQILKYQ